MQNNFKPGFSSVLLFVGLVAASVPTSVSANATPGSLDEAKEIIADLHRVVTPDSVQETFKAEIGGVDQWISVRGRDRDNPLLLFVHGGPASPMMPVAWTFQRPWEEYFTVVQWDQRGAGKTYNANDPEKIAQTIRVEQFVADTLDVIKLLRDRYDKRKVVLVGHSWGTVLGLKAALKKPEWIHAYVGIGQVISFRENERVSYRHAIAAARADGNEEAVRGLEALAPYPGDKPLTRERILAERKWAWHYVGLSAYRDDSSYYLQAPLLSPLYEASDVAAIRKGGAFTLNHIMEEMTAVDLRDVKKVSFPVFMFMGRHDYMAPSGPIQRWLNELRAPYKRGILFEHSAHLVMLEEPGKTLLTLVNQVRPHATGKAGK